MTFTVAKGFVVLPKSVTASRIDANIKYVKLEAADVETLDGLAAAGKQHRLIKPPWSKSPSWSSLPLLRKLIRRVDCSWRQAGFRRLVHRVGTCVIYRALGSGVPSCHLSSPFPSHLCLAVIYGCELLSLSVRAARASGPWGGPCEGSSSAASSLDCSSRLNDAFNFPFRLSFSLSPHPHHHRSLITDRSAACLVL